MSYSVLRRYTPPTCALEILAKNSPLSRWAGQTVLKDVRFNLSLDDPKLPPEQWVTLRGDRAQLEALQETVQRYVQNLLEQSHDRLTASFAPQSSPAAVSIAPPEPEVGLPSATGISLHPTGLLTHTLHLGSLQTEQSGATVSLSTLQLFDLANALEEYAADVLVPATTRSNWLTASPAWAKIAAAALLVLGVSASIVKVLDAPYASTANSPSSSQGASSNDQRIANQLPPSVPKPSPQPLATTKPLTVPSPPIGSTTPAPGVPVNPGLPTTTVPQAAPVSPINPGDATGQSGQPESTVVVPEKPATKESSQPAPPLVAELPSPDRVDSGARPSASVAQSRSRVAAAPTTDTGPGSAFDVIPQVAEAKRYFVQNWKPPQDLTQTLEYAVSVDANGAVQAVSPLGGPAQAYLAKSGMPPVGAPLVSPLKGRNSANFRVVLGPDGSVLTFLAN